MTISFGDNVRIRESQVTDKLGLSGKIGNVSGETKPSVTNIEVIGNLESDFAFNVFFEDENEQYWFAPHLLEFVDHAVDTTIEIGNMKLIRQTNGTWKETDINPKRKWWQFWRINT